MEVIQGVGSMENSYYKGLEPFWGEWYIDKLIGEGSFGKVFRIVRNTSSGQEEAALKAITIPQNNSEYSEMLSYESDEHTVNAYFKDAVMNLNKETLLMAALRGNKNIVEYQDHVVNEHKNEVGWDILIRMELLTSLTNLLRERNLKRDEVVKLGIDICNALSACQKYGIIHRDIKPANIFIDKNGNYKLGDFGVSRAMEKTQGFMSKKGTYSFMAPEVYKGESYGVAADIYSLGMVMYFLMNARKIPFQPFESKGLSFRVREECLNRRMSGETIPAPVFADKALAEIILKACNFNQENRYHSAKEMADDLSKLIIINQKQDEQTWESSHLENRKESRPEAQPASVENKENLNAAQYRHEEPIKSEELIKREEQGKPEESVIVDDDLDSDRTIAMFETLPSAQGIDVKPQYQYTNPVEEVADLVVEKNTEESRENENNNEDDSPISDTTPKKDKKKTNYGILVVVCLLIILGVFNSNLTNSGRTKTKSVNSKDVRKETTSSENPKETTSSENPKETTTQESPEQRFNRYYEMAKGGDKYGMYHLAYMYQCGDGIKQDYEKAIEWYEKAAESGHVTSLERLVDLGLRYEEGDGVAQNYTKAKELYEKAAECGSEKALVNLFDLGLKYEEEGSNQDYEKAKECFEKAAEGGGAGAMNNIGILYFHGKGVEQDFKKAKEWFEKAAEGGETYAMANLGEMYLNGYGVKKDYAKAKEWCEKAAEDGNSKAITNLGYMYLYGYGVNRDYERAKELCEEAAKDEVAAITNLGYMYLNGFGVDRDYTKAKELFEKAAEAGETTAMNNLGIIYENGLGVEKDAAKAEEWYQKAREAGT
ncbi:protein kinase domain-containing protein [Oribacterium sp. FC2011]|uniref:protein kinase domain-containing protein n=1 Tax=Oribacterium sp. FC2011 TaxID=1408311 RepID=UPI0009DD233B|nr:protein kinase [Oribacterium sp. FC2011]